MTKSRQRSCSRRAFVSMGLVSLACMGAGACWVAMQQDASISVSSYELTLPKLPAAFHGFKIVQLSDIHNNPDFLDTDMQAPSRLMRSVLELKPDLIVFTGDLIDSRRPRIDVALQYVAEASQIAPCYFVTGNHERRPLSDPNARDEDVATYDDLQSVETLYSTHAAALEHAGCTLLDGRSVLLSRTHTDDSIHQVLLAGMPDALGLSQATYQAMLRRLVTPKLTDGAVFQQQVCKILLSHRPERCHAYADAGFDVAFSGHAHGGQWRFPCIGAVFAPNQGLWPRYTSGVHQITGTDGHLMQQVISRGLGNSSFPIRINNPFEIVSTTLYSHRLPK